MALARAHLESLLREKKLDVTLAHVRPPADDRPALSTGRGELDEALGGGWPRGELSELTGSRSAGKTTVMCAALASATRHGELAVLVDALDRFDVESAVSMGINLPRLLWVRGLPTSVCGADPARAGKLRGPASGPDTAWRAVERAVKAFTLVLESRAFGLAVCDLADVPAPALRRLPFTTWFRLARLIEGSRTAALLVAPERLGRSAGGVTVALDGDVAPQWRGRSDRARVFEGVVPRTRVLGRR